MVEATTWATTWATALAATRLGLAAELAILRELASGAHQHPALASDELLSCIEVIERYRDQNIGVADASLLVLARRNRTKTILTLDRRHFGVMRPDGAGSSCCRVDGRW